MFPAKRPLMTTSVMSVFCNPQNGVVENEPDEKRSRAIAPFVGNVNPDEALKRPKILAVFSGVGRVATKIRREEESSLPCTPEMEPDSGLDVASCPTLHELLDGLTRELIENLLRDSVEHKGPHWSDSKRLSTAKRVVAGLLEKHTYAYNGMMKNLKSQLDKEGTITAVAKSLFGDGTTNWGRIASLLAFGVVVCRYLSEQGREDSVELVGQEISSYLLTDQRDWLVKNNSWDGFVEFFREADTEVMVRNTLLRLAGVAGIGATLALLIR